MDLGLRNKTAIITGSSRGLGKAIAMALAREQCNLILCVRNNDNDKILRLSQEIRAINKNIYVHYQNVNVINSESIKKLFEFLISIRQPLDILVNNIGNIEKFGGFNDYSDEDWFNCYNLTLMSVVRFTRAAIPLLTKSAQGRIINISSLVSLQPGRSFHPYVAAKAAVNAFTKQMATEFASKNILVNAICLPTLSGDSWQKSIQNRAKRENATIEQTKKIMTEEEEKKSPLGRICTLEEAANMVVFLASDRSSFVTGDIIKVDGGITKGI